VFIAAELVAQIEKRLTRPNSDEDNQIRLLNDDSPVAQLVQQVRVCVFMLHVYISGWSIGACLDG
jgi:hypothetical protein